MRRLELQNGTARIRLAGAEIVVGRARDCHLVLEGARVSRRHARFSWDGEASVLEDLGSRNGVLVNALPVTAPVRLRHGDRVTIGGHELAVVDPARETAEALAQHVPEMSEGFGAIRPASTDELTTGTGRSLAVLEALAIRALELGERDEAIAILGPGLDEVLAAARAGRAPDAVDLRIAARSARLLAATAGPLERWVRYLVELHGEVGEVPDDDVVGLLCAHAAFVAEGDGLGALVRRLAPLPHDAEAQRRLERLAVAAGAAVPGRGQDPLFSASGR
ncbi:MAG: FHA domain-containing protein [Myxococcota bacterium]